MMTFHEIIEAGAQMPWRDFALGTLVTTTALSTSLLWRISQQLDPRLGTEVLDTLEKTMSEAEDALSTITYGSQWSYVGATRKGEVRTENQDAYSTWQADDGTVYLGVFDGAGGVEGGREASQTAAAVVRDYIAENYKSDIDGKTLLIEAIEVARNLFEALELTGITTAIIVLLQVEQMHFATLGDGALASVWPNGMVHHVLVPHHVLGQPDNVIAGYIGKNCDAPPRVGTLTLEPDTHLMLMSDGVSDLFPYDQYAELREEFADKSKTMRDPNLAENFLVQIEQARDPETGAFFHSDNLTLILAHLSLAEEEADNVQISDD